jgi:PTS system fructose-specific IIC component
MLPFVVGGGVLIALSFLFGIYSADPNHEQYNQFAALLNKIGGLSFSLMVPILAAFIAESISKRPGMVVGFIGGLLANQGGAGFLGGIIAGFLAGYLIILLQKLLKNMPKSLDGLKSIFLYPVLGIFLIGAIMTPILVPVTGLNEGMMAFLASVQSSNPLLLGIIVGMMSGFDMGGPFNKAAYVTGTALLSEGNLYFMAGVSAACIAPPLIIAFATVFFRKYFTKDERNAGMINFILGSTHITEGAIPFAAKNPVVVIPIIMLGSSIAAIMTYMFGVQVPAPHGGFLVLPVVTGAIQWVFSILAGSIIAAVIYGLYRKKIAKNIPVEE